ncbi:MAG: efflux RND transporter periplasmic adaptor subunit [Chitinophagaceae bacterium]
MKQFINIFLAGSLIFFAIGCRQRVEDKAAVVKKKQKELQTKKDAVTKLNTDIASLETEITKLDPSTAKKEKAKLVALATVTKSEFVHYIDLQGKVDAENISYVTPRGQGGQVRSILVKKGDRVKKGQLLLTLDNSLVKENLQTAQTQLAYAENIYQRQKNLWDQQIGTEVQLITARNNVDQAKRNIATLQEQQSFSNVYAHVNGIADEVSIRVGEMFTGMPTSGIKIVNNSELKVITDVPENYISKVKKGTPVVITIPDLNKTYNSSISLISQSIGTSSRGFSAESKLPADANLKPNQIALIKIQDYKASGAIVIPVNVVQTDEKGKFVLVGVNESGKMIAKKKSVILGELYGDKIEITSGLAENDVLITEGYQNLYEGEMIVTRPSNG